MTNRDADAVFTALADATRREILRMVADDAPVTATNLAGRLPVTRQAIVKHLGVLRDARLVEPERVGRETRWTPTLEALDSVDRWIADLGARWDTRLSRLERVVSDRRARR
jgi:DNA-binding transcriptional ArsR family regulator